MHRRSRSRSPKRHRDYKSSRHSSHRHDDHDRDSRSRHNSERDRENYHRSRDRDYHHRKDSFQKPTDSHRSHHRSNKRSPEPDSKTNFDSSVVVFGGTKGAKLKPFIPTQRMVTKTKLNEQLDTDKI